MKLNTSSEIKVFFAVLIIMWILSIYVCVDSAIQEHRYDALEDLRPCPFCGSTNVTYNEWSDGIEMYNQAQDYDIATVQCEDCRAEIHTYWHESDNAKSRWNSRK